MFEEIKTAGLKDKRVCAKEVCVKTNRAKGVCRKGETLSKEIPVRKAHSREEYPEGTRASKVQLKSLLANIGVGTTCAVGALAAIASLMTWGMRVQAGIGWILIMLCAVISYVDYTTRRIPNAYVIAIVLVGGVGVVCGFLEPHYMHQITSCLDGWGIVSTLEPSDGAIVYAGLFAAELLDHIAGAICGAIPFLVVRIFTKGIGAGDIKLMAALGFALGWQHVLGVLVLSILIGGAYALFLVKFRNAGRSTTFAFGPCICVAAIVMLVGGRWLIGTM